MAETTFPEFITARRRELELTLGDVASTVGVSPITVSNWSNGQSVPKQANLVALAKVLDLPADELADLAGVELEPEPEPEPEPKLETIEGEVSDDEVAAAAHADEPPEVRIPTIEHPTLDAAEAASRQLEAAEEATGPESIEVEPPELPESVETPAPAPTSGVDVVPGVTAGPTTGQLSPLTYVQDPKQLLRYRIRWAITTVALIIMAFVLFWALAGLFDALSEVKESVTP